MGYLAAQDSLIGAHDPEVTRIVTGLSRKDILLIKSMLVKDAHPVIGRPTEIKILVGIDPCIP